VAFGPVSSIGGHATGQNAGVIDPQLLTTLRDVVGPAHVITDPDRTASAARDWTGRFLGRTPALVRPGTTDSSALRTSWPTASISRRATPRRSAAPSRPTPAACT
jgi:hypothetical protein